MENGISPRSRLNDKSLIKVELNSSSNEQTTTILGLNKCKPKLVKTKQKNLQASQRWAITNFIRYLAREMISPQVSNIQHTQQFHPHSELIIVEHLCIRLTERFIDIRNLHREQALELSNGRWDFAIKIQTRKITAKIWTQPTIHKRWKITE